MSKKFSTLMASLLFASAFTANAAVYEPVEGDFVRLTIGGKHLTIVDKAFKGDVNDPKTDPDNYTTVEPQHTGTYTDVLNGINAQLWKIAKISKTSTGEPTYQFVNKLTGEYLAVKLQNNNKTEDDGVRTTKNVKLDPTGNKTWAIKDGKLYAYTSADSTYSLKVEDSGSLSLQSVKGTKVDNIGQSFAFKNNIPALDLKADAFNALMGLVGSNGKLNFNGGKDVSEKETNILKNTAWTAVKFNGDDDSFALKDGSKKTGYTDAMELKNAEKPSEGYKTGDKLNYLMVDTIAYDADNTYFSLVKDTLPFEYSAENYFGGGANSGKKPAKTRVADLAKFKATYYANKDSIALFAQAFPKKAVATAGVSSKFTVGNTNYYNTDDVLGLFNGAFEEADLKDLRAAVQAVKSAYDLFVRVNEERTADETFANETFSINGIEFTGEGLLNAASRAKFTNNQNLTDWLSAFAGLKFNAGVPGDGTILTNIATYETDGAGDGHFNAIKGAIANLGKALTAWKKAYIAGAVTTDFKNSYYKANEDGTYAVVGTETEGYIVATNEAGVYGAVGTAGYVEGEDGVAKVIMQAIDAMSSTAAKYSTTTETTLDTETITAYNGGYTAEQGLIAALNTLKAQARNWANASAAGSFKNAYFDGSYGFMGYEAGDQQPQLAALNTASISDGSIKGLKTNLEQLAYSAGNAEALADVYYDGVHALEKVAAPSAVVLQKLSSATVLTIAKCAYPGSLTAEAPQGHILPLIQPYASAGGDATITTAAKVYNLQVKNVGNHSALRATNKETGKYLVATNLPGAATTVVEEVDPSNVYAQWAFIPGASGSYSIVSRAVEGLTYYTGPVFQVKDADGNAVADTYVLGADTLAIAGVDLSAANIKEESGVKYDYTGAFYAGDPKGLTQSFAIAPASQYLTSLAVQYKSDSTMVLGAAEDAPVWYFEAGTPATYGNVIEGVPTLKKVSYKIYTKDADNNKYYVYQDGDTYAISLLGSEHVGPEAGEASAFDFRTVAKDTYLLLDKNGKKMTINPTPKQPILEVSDITSERNDYFTITKAEAGIYRKLTAEDGVLGNAKIHMENEPNRYLYENTANIVANNGKGHNFLGIYNTAELTKNAALYVDTAYVEREGNVMPQYMFALGLTEVPAADAVPCSYEHNHFDNAGNKVDAAHCSHATPATMGYKSGRYLVALTDSVPENGSSNSPVYYDGKNVRLAFVPAIHREKEDSLIITKSKWTGNSKQIVKGEKTTYASKDTMKIANEALNNGTFALLIKDQATKSFYLQTKNSGDNAQFVRILNGVPVLTTDKLSAAVFNIEATEENATANEAIAAEGVQVIAGKGAVTVQGAAGKVITVANILGQTIANQVATSDNVTIAAPAGVVVVAVEGEATKVVVK